VGDATDGAPELPSRCCTYNDIHVHVPTDSNPFQKTEDYSSTTANFKNTAVKADVVKNLPAASAGRKATSTYVDIPESKSVADAIACWWTSRQQESTGILLHGPSGCGKTASIRKIMSELLIPCNYFDCADLYSRDLSLFSEAVDSITRQSKSRSTTAESNAGAVVVLDRLDCMFPPLSPHAQVLDCAQVVFFVTLMTTFSSFMNAVHFCIVYRRSINYLMNPKFS
jgi:hypothetical protein